MNTTQIDKDAEAVKKVLEKINVNKQLYEFVSFLILQIMMAERTNKRKQAGNKELIRNWHDNGNIYCEIPFENGVKNGTLKMWQPNGKLMCEVPYENDEIKGNALIYRKEYAEVIVFK